MPKQHRYTTILTWTGAAQGATTSYSAYSRDHEIRAGDKPPILASSDAAFRGNASHYNPEEMLVAALSACHMLWYLHLCAVNRIAVTAYSDSAEGVMIEETGAGRFEQVILRPSVTVRPGADVELAHALHEQAHEECFIANSVNFPVHHDAVVKVAPGGDA